MGNTSSENKFQINIYFHLEHLIGRWYGKANAIDRNSELKRASSVWIGDKLVDDPKLNKELLSATFDQIDQASRTVKYDFRRKMSYFEF